MHTCNIADQCNLGSSAAQGSQKRGTEADAMGSSPLLLHQQAEVLAAEGGGAEAPGPIKARPVPVAPARYTPGFTSEAHASTAAAYPAPPHVILRTWELISPSQQQRNNDMLLCCEH